MTQVQILFSLIGAASPALKKTMLDLMTNFGAASESQANSRAKYGGSFPLKYINSKINSKRDVSQPSENDSKPRFVPFIGGETRGTAVVSVTRSNTHHKGVSDGDSQEGIIRQDDFQVSYDAETPDRDLSMEEGYVRAR